MTYYPTAWKASFRFFNSPALSVHGCTLFGKPNVNQFPNQRASLQPHYQPTKQRSESVCSNFHASLQSDFHLAVIFPGTQNTGYRIRDPNNLSTRISCPELKVLTRRHIPGALDFLPVLSASPGAFSSPPILRGTRPGSCSFSLSKREHTAYGHLRTTAHCVAQLRIAAKVRNKGLANFLSHRLDTGQSKAPFCRTRQ